MTVVFADTAYYLALASPSDMDHQKAVELTRQLKGRMLTTAWVLTEVLDGMSAPRVRRHAIELINDLRVNPKVAIIPPSPELFDAGFDFFRRRPDKEWSLTDCVSFVVMEREGLRDAATTDHHFEQAGFNVLLK